MQEKAEEPLKVPTTQTPQTDSATEEAFPAVQGVQDADPAEDHLPAEQSTQLVPAVAFPATQSVHVELPEPEYFPIPQVTHHISESWYADPAELE